MILESKQCSKCGELKSSNDYYSQKRKSKEGVEWIYYNPECKICSKKRSVKFQNENREKKAEYNKRHNAKPDRKEKNKIHKRNYRESGGQLNWQRNNTDKLNSYHHENHDISYRQWESCKDYFNQSCAYCELHIIDHLHSFMGRVRWTDLHKEHVDHQGSNDLSNCVPACQSCNSQKWTFPLDEWYNESNKRYTKERMEKINNWITGDYKLYL